MNNFLEKILIIETLEKIFRLQAFLSKASIKASDPDLKVIELYNSAIKEILKSLEIVIYKLHKEYGVLEENERFSCMRRISDVFNSIDDFHSQLRFIHGEWTIPETYLFVKNLFKSVLKNKDDVSIVLSDIYMFEEVDLSRYLEYRLNVYNIQADLYGIRPTLFLPKIEYSNPLNWTILVHEMGHILKKPLENIFSYKEINKISSSADGITMLENWTEEVLCDLIAIRLLGPSYLASYITFSILLASSGKIEESSPTHPADRFRISIMKNFLQKEGIELHLKNEFSEFKNISNFFDNLFEERCNFEREYNIEYLPPISQFPINYQKFRDFLVEKIDILTHDKIPYLEIDNKKIRVLSDRLSNGILIGSSRENQDTKSQIDNLDEIDNIMRKKEDTNKKRIKVEDLMKQVLDFTKENPNNIGEIINAGWQYKCEKYYPFILDLLFNKCEDINYCYEIFRNKIFSLDEKLTKSIEISYIHNLFGEEVQNDSK